MFSSFKGLDYLPIMTIRGGKAAVNNGGKKYHIINIIYVIIIEITTTIITENTKLDGSF